MPMSLLLENNILDNQLSLKEALKYIDLNSKKEHFTEKEFMRLLEMMSNSQVAPNDFIRKNIRGYRKTIDKFKSLEEWELADEDNKFIVNKGLYSNGLYYQAMIISGRLCFNWKDMNDNYRWLPEPLTKDEYWQIFNIVKELGYKMNTLGKVFNIIRVIMLCTKKELKEIDIIDIESYKKYVTKEDRKNGLLTAIYVLRELGNINSKDVYYFTKNKTNSEKTIDSGCSMMMKMFIEFESNDKERCYYDTHAIRKRCAKSFIKWIEEYYPKITIGELREKHIIEYFQNVKNSRKESGEKKYSESTINGYLSHLKSGFLKYMKDNNYLSKELDAYIFSSNSKYFELYYEKSKIKYNPIALEDRINIERAIYSREQYVDEVFQKMFILLYQLGMRPFEALLLKLDCLRGTKELPQLYIHRAKKFKQRYIPLTTECLDIINEFRRININSPEIYSEADGLSCQRLFNVKGKVPHIVALEDNFRSMMIENKIINNKGEAKFSLYVLRRLRITLWLESGISETVVAKLVGHDDVDSHNHYIVSKEIRIENCKKVFNKFYSNLLDDTENIDEINKREDQEDFIEKLNKELLAIENKTVNNLAMESIMEEFPEYLLPVACGLCVAKAFQEDFECEMMNIPCIECEQLKQDSIEIIKFDDLIYRIFKNINVQKKKGLQGLLEKSNKKIDRLKIFYKNKFGLSDIEVEKRFKEVENSTIIKRGRKRKEVIKDEY